MLSSHPLTSHMSASRRAIQRLAGHLEPTSGLTSSLFAGLISPQRLRRLHLGHPQALLNQLRIWMMDVPIYPLTFAPPTSITRTVKTIILILVGGVYVKETLTIHSIHARHRPRHLRRTRQLREPPLRYQHHRPHNIQRTILQALWRLRFQLMSLRVSPRQRPRTIQLMNQRSILQIQLTDLQART